MLHATWRNEEIVILWHFSKQKLLVLTNFNMMKPFEEYISSIIHCKKIGNLYICSDTQRYMAVHKGGAWGEGWSTTRFGNLDIVYRNSSILKQSSINVIVNSSHSEL